MMHIVCEQQQIRGSTVLGPQLRRYQLMNVGETCYITLDPVLFMYHGVNTNFGR